jgi:hypothetical protein
MDLSKAEKELTELVGTAKDERPVQVFLESNPHLFSCGPRHVIDNVIISQLPLGADHRPDFAYVFFNSTGLYLELFEIESPRMKMFLKDDNFSKPYLDAIQQTQDWLGWTKSNQDHLFFLFESLIGDLGFGRQMTVFCNLVAGRRIQLENDLRKRRYKQKWDQYYPGTTIMTCDRFMEEIARRGSVSSDKSWKCVHYKRQSFFEKEIVKIKNQSFS